MAKELPLRVLREVCWSFVGAPLPNRDVFDARVRQYQIRIRKKPTWQPQEIVLSVPRVAVRYRCWRGDEELEPVLLFTADDGVSFTAVELLFKLHNAVVEQLNDLDHHFFEGSTLAGWHDNGQVPLYQLRLGS